MSDRFALSGGAADDRPFRVKRAAWDDFVTGLRCLDNAAQDIAKAGQLFASIPEADWERILDDSRMQPFRRTLENARKCGQGLMIPQLVTASGAYVSRLRTFPVGEQAKYLTEPVPVAITKGGKDDVKMVMVSNLTGDEVRQVFVKDGSAWVQRSIEDQRVWLRHEEKRRARLRELESSREIDRPNRWAIRRGRVHIAAAKYKAGLTKSDLEQMLKDLSP